MERTMRYATRNILDAVGKVDAICITTNGFTTKYGKAVMGRGIAKTFSELVPNLEMKLGKLIEDNGNKVQFICEYNNTALISVPSKPISVIFNGDNIVAYQQKNFEVGQKVPGFFAKSDLGIIERSLIELVELTKDLDVIVVPLIGCGAGELSFSKDVRHLMERYLDNRFIACSFKEADFYK